MVTANDIFNATMALMFGTEEDKADYQSFFLPALNLLAAENFALNNAVRLLAGKPRLSVMPVIASMSDPVDYEEIFVRAVFPYGCAGLLYADDDKALAADYKNKYEFMRAGVLGSEYQEIGYGENNE